MPDDSSSEDLLSKRRHDEGIHVESSLEHVLESRKIFGTLRKTEKGKERERMASGNEDADASRDFERFALISIITIPRMSFE